MLVSNSTIQMLKFCIKNNEIVIVQIKSRDRSYAVPIWHNKRKSLCFFKISKSIHDFNEDML